MKGYQVISMAGQSLLSAGLVSSLLLISYFAFEPMVTKAATTASFTVTQEITGEISITTPPTNVTMSSSIAGMTGGSASGYTDVRVTSNNATGYNMTIAFSNAVAMKHHTLANTIPNYVPAVAGTPDYSFVMPTNSAGFAYNIDASDVATDVAAKFRDSGSVCGTGNLVTSDSCWYGTADATMAETIVNRPNATPALGAETTIGFHVGVDANPSPALPTGFYTATATLTVANNP